ncbi:MAG: hypothetical protein HQK92_04440 [Nitrospirae bacterium]|nr:hypothetical protein [Nitrospirota bacterium]
MGFFGLCRQDEILDILRNTYKAEVLKIPEERVKPFCVIARKNNNFNFWGELSHLVNNGTQIRATNFESSLMAELSGKQSSKLKTSIGFQIIDSFLQGFGVPSPDIKSKINNVSLLSFSFKDVKRMYITPAKMGQILIKHEINVRNSASMIFFPPHSYEFLVIDSIIICNNFSIHIKKSTDYKGKIDFGAIKEMLKCTDMHIEINKASDISITFKSNKYLTFSFTVVKFILETNGKISIILPDNKTIKKIDFSTYRSYSKLSTLNYGRDISLADLEDDFICPQNVLITDEPGFISWDNN